MLIELALRFKESSVLLAFALVAVAGALWAYFVFRKKAALSFWPVAVLNLGLLVIWARLAGIDHDESAHLHLAWMISQGLVPFRDFWMHHSPLLWLLLAPLYQIIKPSAWLFEITRLIAGLIFTANALLGWRIARDVWGKQARVSMYLLVLFSCAIPGEVLFIRSDIFMVFFLLAGIYFSLRILNARMAPVFWAGICLAMAASFVFKQYLLFFLPVIAVLLVRRQGRLKRLFFYLAGYAFAAAPLVWYFLRHDIMRDYLFWGIAFNSRIIVFSIFFPLGVGCLGGWGAYLLWKRYRQQGDAKALILCSAFLFSTISSLTSVSFLNGRYYLMFWFFMCALLASGCHVEQAFAGFTSLLKRPIAIGIFVSLLVTPNVIYTVKHRDSFFSRDKEAITGLMKYAAGDTCLTILPLHPVCARDATRLYSFWQYYFLPVHECIKNDLQKDGIAAQILSSPPAVIKYILVEREVLLELLLLELISKDGYRELKALLQERYTVRNIGEQKYYIRNDRL